MKRLLILSLISLTIIVYTPNAMATKEVGEGYAYISIQDAINDAIHGETILVHDGTYIENINFIGKAITIRSENGAANTFIDGNRVGIVVCFNQNEESNSVLRGFTIKNGFNENGGGILCENSSPIIENCRIIENTASLNGGGIYCFNANPKIINSFLENNRSNGEPNQICLNYNQIMYNDLQILKCSDDESIHIHNQNTGKWRSCYRFFEKLCFTDIQIQDNEFLFIPFFQPSIVFPTSISIDPNIICLFNIGQTQQLSVISIFSDMTDSNITSSKSGITYLSSDPNIASLDGEGLVTAEGFGETTITAAYNGLSSTIEVFVTVVPISSKILDLKVDPNVIYLNSRGQSEKLTVTVTYSVTYSDTNTRIFIDSPAPATYVSSDPNVASIDEDGLVTAIGNGTAIITATDSDFSDSAMVVVYLLELKIQNINASSQFVEKNNQVALECSTININPNATLNYQWYIEGEILPDTDNNIVWIAPDNTGIYKICCRVNDIYDYEDYRCFKIPVVDLSENNPPFVLIEKEMYVIKAGEELILRYPEFRAVDPDGDEPYFSCNVGIIGRDENGRPVYKFKQHFQGSYIVEIIGYDIRGASHTAEFFLDVKPFWSY
jgi:uncharacterized protein YjdB